MRLALAVTLCGFVAACSGTIKDAGEAQLSASPVLGGGSYSSGGGITVAVDVTRNADGLTQVCGAWAQSAQQSVLTKGKAKRVLGTGSVYLGDTALVRGLNFMNEVAPASSYAGVTANCVRTWQAWLAEDGNKPVTIRIPQQEVYRDADDEGVVIVSFKPI